ncbi:MAG: hypothetical protein GKS05_08420 [Nitrospirales bacterium]|nr:hypothetical protein [Nitrospirales bacterium]
MNHEPTMQYQVAVSRHTNPDQAGQELGMALRASMGKDPVDVAFIFYPPYYKDMISQLLSHIHETLSPRVLLGCMGESIIGMDKEFEETTAVTVWAARLPHCHLVPMHLTFDEVEHGYIMDGWPEGLDHSAEHPTFILLADPFSTPMNEVFSQIEQRCPGAPAIGGVASGGTDLGESQLVLNNDIIQTGLVGIAMWGPLSIRTIVSQGCQPIGEPYVVTRAERYIVYELGGMPTLERLQATLDALGPERGKQATMGLQVGVAFNEHRHQFNRGDFLIRGIMGADQQSGGIALSDLIEEGQTIQFHLRDSAAASEELNLLLAQERDQFSKAPPKGALLFSCHGRGRRFFPHPHHDIEAVLHQTGHIPIAGFFAAGEIGPVAGKNFIHGYTASLALFS